MRNITHNFETPGKKRPRIERNLLFSTELKVLLKVEGNNQPFLQQQSKYGKTDEEIMGHIISEFSRGAGYSKIL